MARDEKLQQLFETSREPSPDGASSTAVLDHDPLGNSPSSTDDLQGSIHDMPPPVDRFQGNGNDMNRLVAGDGRVDVDFNSRLVSTLSALYRASDKKALLDAPPGYPEAQGQCFTTVPKLNIVIQVVGSRGDVQPFVALGNELVRYGHRVRLATHDVFEGFVRDANLEFYPIGGDPAELMAYMVKNPGLIPSMKTLKAGEISRKRCMVAEMLDGLWASCVQPDRFTGDPFVADAIIANPPSFAHVHCAQALGIPVHLMFTMPWSPTAAFPHPLANLKNTTGNESFANFLSYEVVDWLTWQGLGNVINKWRKSIDLEEVAMFDGPTLIQTLKVPFTYCWSPALIPKPAEWSPHIDVCGFFFRDPPQYDPPQELREFLVAGSPPVYIGFGSIVLEDASAMTSTILEAVGIAGVRAIVSKGWSSLQGSPNENVYFIGDCPHEWLFQQVAAVVHHGGAGTTACGLRFGKPTTIVPFFGDQPFWGHMVANARAGPRPIPHRELTAASLAEAIRYCLSSQACAAAVALADKMRRDSGVQTAMQSFHRTLPVKALCCDILHDQPATWVYTGAKSPVKLSKMTAELFLANNFIEMKHLKRFDTNPITIETTRWDPISGGGSAVMATSVDMTSALTGMFTRPIKEYRDEKRQVACRREINDQSASQDDLSPSPSVNSEVPGYLETQTQKSKSGLAGKMIGASAKSIGSLAPTALKGMMVDIPLAITEGLRSIPQHYGDDVRDHGKVTDMRSGAIVAGKTFTWGLVDGISDLVVQPYKGAKENGVLGALRGVGKGVVGLTTKSGAGMFGLLAYTGAGISKSAQSALHSRTRKLIIEQRLKEGQWLVQDRKAAGVDANVLWTTFQALAQKGKS